MVGYTSTVWRGQGREILIRTLSGSSVLLPLPLSRSFSLPSSTCSYGSGTTPSPAPLTILGNQTVSGNERMEWFDT